MRVAVCSWGEEGADGAGERLLAHAGGAAVRARGVLGGVPAVLVADRSG